MALITKGNMPEDCGKCDLFIMLPQCPLPPNGPFVYRDGTRHPDCPIIGEISDIALCEFLADKLVPPTTAEELYQRLFKKAEN